MDIGKVVQKVSDYIDQKFIKKDGEIISNTNRTYCSAIKLFYKYKSKHGESNKFRMNKSDAG